MISLKQTKHIANLARIKFGQSELKELQNELSSILGYVNKLKEVDIKEIKPSSHSVLVKNVFRSDKSQQGTGQIKKDLINLAPAQDKGFIKTKSVFTPLIKKRLTGFRR